MAVPKRKVSKARRDKRRSNVWKLALPGMVKCPKCGEYNRAHRVCGACGYYKGEVHHSTKEAAYLRYTAERVARFPRVLRRSETAYRLYRRVTPLRTLPSRAGHKLLRILKIEKQK